MPDNVRTIVHKNFLGLRKSVADPPSNSAKDMSNLVLHRRRGILETSDGYDQKFDGLPQCTDENAPNYFSPTIYNIVSLEFSNLHNLRVTEHGGKNITLAIGKAVRVHANIDNGGTSSGISIWARPYWDEIQQLWSDDLGWDNNKPRWQEISEYMAFEIVGFVAGDILAKTDEGGSLTNLAHTGGTIDWDLGTSGAGIRLLTHNPPSNPNPDISKYLHIGGVALNPSGAITIEGVEVYVVRRTLGEFHLIFDESVRITKNGVPVGTDRFADNHDWTTGPEFEVVKYGGPNDLWGTGGFLTTDLLGFALAVGTPPGPLFPHGARYGTVDNIYFVFYYKTAAGHRIVVDSGGVFDFPTKDPTGLVFNDNHFKGWTIVYESLSQTSENYDRIKACGYDGTDYFLELYHPTSDFSSRVSGTKIFAFKNFIWRDLPFDFQSYLYNLFNEARLTMGNDAPEASMMIGFRQANLLIVGSMQVNIDSLMMDTQVMDVWPEAVMMSFGALVVADAEHRLPAGTYNFKYALRMDNGAVTRLYDAGESNADDPLDLVQIHQSAVVADGASTIKLYLYRSLGAFPRRAKSILIYASDDAERYFQIDEIDLTSDSFYTGVGTVTDGASFTHFYAYGLFTFDNLMWQGDNSEASVWDDKANDDDGIIRYSHAMVLQPRIYAAGVRDASQNKLYPNQIFLSAITGDSVAQYDVFPNDESHVIDLEYSDGDELRALGSVDQTIVAIKKRSVVTVVQDRFAGFVRQLVTKGYGIASVTTLVSFDDILMWLDYNAVVEFSTRGIRVLNPAWIQDLRDMSDAAKESAIAVFDRVNRQYRLYLDGRLYSMDFDTKEWTIDDYVASPSNFAVNENGKIDFITVDGIETISTGDGLQAGESFEFFFESNQIQHVEDDEDVDLNIVALYLRYHSDVDLTLRLFKNDTNEEIGGSPWTLPSGKTRVRVKPIEARSSSFRVKISGTIEDGGQKASVLRLGGKYEILPAGGTELEE